jgi:hypothetical protein
LRPAAAARRGSIRAPSPPPSCARSSWPRWSHARLFGCCRPSAPPLTTAADVAPSSTTPRTATGPTESGAASGTGVRTAALSAPAPAERLRTSSPSLGVASPASVVFPARSTGGLDMRTHPEPFQASL